MASPAIPTEIRCPVCSDLIVAFITTSKKGRHAIGLKCPRDGRDFRAYINTKTYVEPMLDRIAQMGGLPPGTTEPKTPSKMPEGVGRVSVAGSPPNGR